MLTSTSFVAALSIFTLSFAAPIRNVVSTHTLLARNVYIMFGGDGSLATGWPSRKSWLSFDDAWEANLDTIQNSCQVEGWGENNSDAETQAMKDSITAESSSTGIPQVAALQAASRCVSHLDCANKSQEFILAIVMQESKGCVRVPTTRWSHENPGLMQSAQGKGSCNPDGNPISPCSATVIRLMIHDGTNGDSLETTLKQCIADAGTSDDSKYYKAARLYNAGRITDNNLGIGPTPCYASDIANRLTSPFNYSTCDSAVIATLSSAQGTVSEVNSAPDDATPTVTTAPAAYSATPTSTRIPTSVAAGEIDGSEPEATSSTPNATISGAANECNKYFTPQSGDTCASAPVDFATLRKLNTQLNSDCTNLWAGYAYCIAV